MGWDVQIADKKAPEDGTFVDRRRPGRRWIPWGRFFCPRDSFGRESRTLFFVGTGIGLAWIAIILVFVKFMWPDSTMSATEFAMAIVALGGLIVTLIGAWLGREWLSRTRSSPVATEK